jgi:hypothetical protein
VDRASTTTVTNRDVANVLTRKTIGTIEPSKGSRSSSRVLL